MRDQRRTSRVVTPKYLYPRGTSTRQAGSSGATVPESTTGAAIGATLYPYEFRREVDYGSAAALMVKAELWRSVGGFDERFVPMYYEDVDLCFQAASAG